MAYRRNLMYAIIVPHSTLYESTVLYGSTAERCIEEIREVRSANYVDVIGKNVLVSILPYLSVSKVIRYMKWKVSEKRKGNSGTLISSMQRVLTCIPSKYAGG